MITLRRLDLIREQAPAVAEELANVQRQINALPTVKPQTQTTAGALAGYVEIEISGTTYVLPFYAKA